MNLLYTVTGSRLYGFAGADSDYDTYAVVETGPNKHSVVGLDDVAIINLETFLGHLEKGVPQAIEALWSDKREIAKDWEAYFNSLKPSLSGMLDTYPRVIKKFMEKDTPKGRRHAMRLANNLADMYDRGKFNPTLERQRADLFIWAAGSSFVTRYLVDQISPVAIW